MELASERRRSQQCLLNHPKTLLAVLPERFLVRLQDCAGLSSFASKSNVDLYGPAELGPARTLLARIHRQRCSYDSCMAALQAALIAILSHREVLRVHFCKALQELALLHEAQGQLDLSTEVWAVRQHLLTLRSWTALHCPLQCVRASL